MIAMAAVSPFRSNESVSLPQLQDESVDGDEDPPSSSVDFGNLETLSHIRSLTDVGAMTRLLHECIAYQRGLDLRLESLLAQRPDLDRHLFSIQRCSHLLDVARSDAGILLDSVRSTANLADQVSRKVRELDLAQSRVESTLSRIDAIVESSHCLDGARRAIDSDDYDSAARFIHTFLQIDARFRDSGSDQREQLLECKRKLESVVRSRLSAAIDKRDHHTILRFIHVFPPLGLQEEGLQIYVSYLRKVISLRSRLEFEHLMEIAEKGDHLVSNLGQGGANFVTCLTNLFKDIVLAVEDNDEVLRSLCGEDGIVYSICELQEECDSRGTQILKKYLDYRKLSRLASEINTYSKNLLSAGSTEGPDPREVEIYLEEILSLMQLGEDYTEFMVSKIRGLGFVDPELGPRATKAFRSGNFNRGVQDLTAFYVILEEFFMVENVRKAITIDEHVTDSLTTSMVDDVFFVLQSCCRRAISSGSSNSILALLSGAINLLTNEYQDGLQQKLREPNIGAKLFLGGVGVQKTGIDIATALNNVDVSAEYVLKLRHEIEEQCAEALPSAGEREKMKSCVSELGEISEGLRRIQRSGMEQLMGSISGRIRPALDSVAGISYELSDAEYEENEVNDPWVGKLIQAVEGSTGWLQPTMTVGNYDSLLHSVIDFTVRRLDAILMQKRFSQLGGLQLDREVRALVTHFSDLSQRPVRDKFARLSQIATILNFERVSEILDFWGENAAHMTWLLTPADVRRVLSLRIDFAPEAIAALRL